MQDMILPLLAAITVVLLVWGIAQVTMGLSGEKKKLQERLSGDGKGQEGFDPATFTVVRRELTITGISGIRTIFPRPGPAFPSLNSRFCRWEWESWDSSR